MRRSSRRKQKSDNSSARYNRMSIKQNNGKFIKISNQKTKQEKHKKIVKKFQTRKEKMKELIPSVLKKLKIRMEGELKKKIGTLNLSRVKAIHEGRHLKMDWWKIRRKRDNKKKEKAIKTMK